MTSIADGTKIRVSLYFYLLRSFCKKLFVALRYLIAFDIVLGAVDLIPFSLGYTFPKAATINLGLLIFRIALSFQSNKSSPILKFKHQYNGSVTDTMLRFDAHDLL